MTMRRLLVLWLVTVYTAFAAGVPVYAHLCGGELKESTVLIPADKGCCPDEAEDDGCCEDDTELVKLEKPQKPEANQWLPAGPVQAVLPASAVLFGTPFLHGAEQAEAASPAVAGFGDLPPPVPLYIFFSCLKVAAPCQA